MDNQQAYALWRRLAVEDPDLIRELEAIEQDQAGISDRFYRDLEFGTGGLRGVIGAGSNRMNLYTVRRATQGLADYLNASDLPKQVAIASGRKVHVIQKGASEGMAELKKMLLEKGE